MSKQFFRAFAVLCFMAAPALGGCNTIAGFGQDVAATGRFIEHGAQSTQEAMFGRSAEAAEAANASPDAGGNAIYFSSDSAELNADGRKMIRAMALEAKRRGTARIEIAGYSDTVGPADHNGYLSQRRAAVVAAALEAQGIPQESIAVNWYGESELAVPTRDGVSSAENRRVVMNFSTG